MAPTGLVTDLPICKLRGRTAGAGEAAAGASRSGEGVERFGDEDGADCCGLGLKVKAVSRPSPEACVSSSSAASAMLGMGGRTGAECEMGDDGTWAEVYDCARWLDGLGEWFRPK